MDALFIYTETLTEFSHMYHPEGLDNASLSHTVMSLDMGSRCGIGADCIFQGGVSAGSKDQLFTYTQKEMAFKFMKRSLTLFIMLEIKVKTILMDKISHGKTIANNAYRNK